MHRILIALLIILHVQHCVLGLDVGQAVVDRDGAGVDRCHIGYAAAAWRFDVARDGVHTESLECISCHGADASDPEEISGLEQTLCIYVAGDAVTHGISRFARTGVLCWWHGAGCPLENINCAARKQLSPTPAGIHDVVLVGIDETCTGGVPPDFTHPGLAPGISVVVDRSYIVGRRINGSKVVQILSDSTQHTTLQRIKEIKILFGTALESIIHEHSVHEIYVDHWCLLPDHLPTGFTCGIDIFDHGSVVGCTVATVRTRCAHQQHAGGVVHCGAKLVQGRDAAVIQLLAKHELTRIGNTRIGRGQEIIGVDHATLCHTIQEFGAATIEHCAISVERAGIERAAVGCADHEIHGAVAHKHTGTKMAVGLGHRTHDGLGVHIGLESQIRKQGTGARHHAQLVQRGCRVKVGDGQHQAGTHDPDLAASDRSRRKCDDASRCVVGVVARG